MKATKASRPHASMPSGLGPRKPDKKSQNIKPRQIKGEVLSSWYQTTLGIADRRLGRRETARAIFHAAAHRHSRCKETDSRGIPVRQLCGEQVFLRVTTGLASKWTGKTTRSCVDAFKVLEDAFGWRVEIGTPNQAASKRTPSVIWIDMADAAGEDLTFAAASQRADEARSQIRQQRRGSRRGFYSLRTRRTFVGEAPLETSSPSGESLFRQASKETTTTLPNAPYLAPEVVVVSEVKPTKPLSPERVLLRDALLCASESMGLGGATRAAAEANDELVYLVVEAGVEFLRGVLAEIRPTERKHNGAEGVLVSRFRRPELARDLCKAAREWTARHPSPAQARSTAYAKWQRRISEIPPEGSASYPYFRDLERQALDDLIARAETELSDRATSMRESLRRTMIEEGGIEGSLVWLRKWHRHWRLMVFEELGLDLRGL